MRVINQPTIRLRILHTRLRKKGMKELQSNWIKLINARDACSTLCELKLQSAKATIVARAKINHCVQVDCSESETDSGII